MLPISIRRAALALLVTAPLAAQDTFTARIVGRVLDAENGRGIPDAGVRVDGTTLGTTTAFDGQFTLNRVPAGSITIHVRRLGYQPKTITGLQLTAGSVVEQSVSLTPNVAQVAAMVVTASAERGSVESAMDEQRTATAIVNSVTAEQISKSPDANAAQAMQRVSGVTVQDGKFVIVRGVPERYTTTSLNGARVPSPEPERKVVPLDLFPSGLIQSVTTTKTFTPDLSGDFSGAQVDIKTKEFPAERQVTYGISMGYAQDTWGQRIGFAPGVGGESVALAGASRGLPANAAAAGDLSRTTQIQGNQIINSFRDVWRAGSRDARPNMSGRMSVGGSAPAFGRRVGYLLSGSYAYSQDFQQGGTRALAQSGAGNTQVAYNQFTGDNSGESVLLGGLLNLSTLVTPHSRVSINSMYSRSADNDARVERGVVEDLSIPLEIQRLAYVERSIWTSQLAGETQKGRHTVNWSITGSGVTRTEPDRSELVYELDTTAAGSERKLWVNSLGEGASRTFSELAERSFEGKASYAYEFGSAEHRMNVRVGGLGRGARRSADTRSYGIFATIMSDSVRALPPEDLFGGRFTQPDSSVLTLRSLAQGGSYTANDAIYAGFGMVEVPLTPMLRMITGARFEQSTATVRAASTLGQKTKATPSFADVLPSIAFNFRPSNTHAFRVSLSRTLARPEYRELAGVLSRDGVARADLRGNPALVRTLIENADIRYEFYPRRGEALSFAVFAKRFHDPIERVSTASSSNSVVTFVNADGADNLGVEAEIRKDLDEVAAFLAPFSLFGGVTVMKSRIHLGQSAASSTNPSRAMVGQSPYVINTGLTYTSRSGRGSATILYNRVGPRIVEAGEQPLPDVLEIARDVVDVSVRWPLRGGMVARMDARNLVDAPRTLRQGTVTREGYRTGRSMQLGMTLQR